MQLVVERVLVFIYMSAVGDNNWEAHVSVSTCIISFVQVFPSYTTSLVPCCLRLDKEGCSVHPIYLYLESS